MTENDKTLVPIFRGEAEQVHPLARFGESRVVRALGDRIIATDRRKIPLNRNEAILTAQAAIAYRLDPFMGELWSWVNTYRDGRRVLTLMRGRDGTLKIAKQNAEKAGTYLLPPRFELVVDEAERIAYQIGQDDMACLCYQQDKLSLDDYYRSINTLKNAGFTAAKIEANVGDPPADVGLGILTAKEITDLDKSGQNKMTHLERVQKRAHMAALRKRFAAQEFGGMDDAASVDTDDYIIEGEWLEIPIDDDNSNRSQEEKEANAAKGKDALFGDDPEKPDRKSPNYWPKAILEIIIEKGYAENEFQAAGMLAYSTFDSKVAKTPSMLYSRAYRAARDNDDTPTEAGAKGMDAYLKTLKRD